MYLHCIEKVRLAWLCVTVIIGHGTHSFLCSILMLCCRLTVEKQGVADALKLTQSLLNVQLLEAIAFTATYYGQLVTDQSHVAVLVKVHAGYMTLVWSLTHYVIPVCVSVLGQEG